MSTIMDSFQARAVGNIRKRHECRIQENAERIQQHIGYVLKRVEDGRADSTGMYAEDIEASVGRILASVAALETLKETIAILETTETTPEETKWKA